MNLYDIYNFNNFILTKEREGNSFTPLQYNNALPIVVQDTYDKLTDKYEEKQKISSSIDRYKVVEGDTNMPLVVDSDGHAILPLDYKLYSSMYYSHNGKKRRVDILTDAQFNHYQTSYTLNPTKKHSICTFRNGYIEFDPKDLETVHFVYIKTPEIPFMDYYIDLNRHLVYMPTGATHMLIHGEVYSDGTTPPVGLSTLITSQTVEVSTSFTIQIKIIVRLLEFASVHIDDDKVLQYSQLLKNENLKTPQPNAQR